MTGERHTPMSAREWAAAILIALIALTAVYSAARSQTRHVDATQAAVTVRSLSNYMAPTGGSQDASATYDGDAVLYEASLADTFLLTDSARRLPDVSEHIHSARVIFEEVRRALAGGASWTQVSTKHDAGLAELDAAKRLLAEKYGCDVPSDFDQARPE
jgi:hypothetical protein